MKKVVALFVILRTWSTGMFPASLPASYHLLSARCKGYTPSRGTKLNVTCWLSRRRENSSLADAGLAVIDGKTAKTANFNAVTAHQGITDGIQNGFDGLFGITLVELAKLGGKFFYEIGSGHRAAETRLKITTGAQGARCL